jgi:1,4-dihydroxy-6-naphthoate synthase
MSLFADSLSLGQSADLEGDFLAFSLTFGRVEAEGLAFEPVLGDQAELDRLAIEEALDVTPVSPSAWAHLADRYVLLNCGARMRRRQGPWLATAMPRVPESLAGAAIALGGEYLSEWVVLGDLLPEARYEVMAGRDAARRLHDGAIDAAAISAEAMARHGEEGLHPALDLAAWWTNGPGGGQPLPLAVWAARRALGAERLARARRVLRRAVADAMDHPRQALAYAVERRPGLALDVAEGIVRESLGPWTRDAEAERAALEKFLSHAAQAGWIPSISFADGFDEPRA